MRTLCLLALILALVACKTAGGTADALSVPVHTTTERQVFVPIDKVLTLPCPVAPSGALSDAPAVAAARKAALETCNAKLAAIAAIQGTPVTPPKDEK